MAKTAPAPPGGGPPPVAGGPPMSKLPIIVSRPNKNGPMSGINCPPLCPDVGGERPVAGNSRTVEKARCIVFRVCVFGDSLNYVCEKGFVFDSIFFCIGIGSTDYSMYANLSFVRLK